MSFCLNPSCPKPDDPLNIYNPICRQCGSQLLLQGRYRAIRLLGEGGFGKTYEVDDRGSRKVLKVLLLNSPKAVSLFQQEASVLSQLHHPGIPQVEPDGYFTFLPKDASEPLHCLVMEKIDGINLEAWLSQRNYQPCSQEQVLTWLRQLAEILLEIHEQLYFHRDIKPSNIMLRTLLPEGATEKNNTEQLVLIDFGSAREVTLTYLAKISGGNTVTGIVSPGYTPIEQANGKAVPQSDFFALGRTFVYLLTGKSPNDFPEDPRSGRLLWHHRATHISKPVTELIDYLMAPFPGNRPHNAQMILHCLDAIELTLRLPQLYSQELQPAHNSKSLHSRSEKMRGNSPLARIKRLAVKVVKSRNEILASCSVLAVALAVIQAYNGLGSTLTQTVDMPLSAREAAHMSSIAEQSQRIQMVSLSAQDKARKKSFPGAIPTANLTGVNSIAFSPDGRTLASASRDGTINLWELNTAKVKIILRGHNQGVNSVAFSPDGQTIASGGEDHTIKLWDVNTGEENHTLQGHQAWVSAVAFSPDGKTLISSSFDNTIKLWDLATDKVRHTLKGHSGWVFSIAVSSRSPVIASSGFDKTIKIWQMKTGELLRTLPSPEEKVFALAISPDGEILASGGGDGTIHLWRLRSGKLLRTLKGHTDWVRCLAFSPDGETLASGSGNRDSTIKLWEADSGELLHTLRGHTDHVRSVAFSPDGKTLASASYDNTIKMWRLQK